MLSCLGSESEVSALCIGTCCFPRIVCEITVGPRLASLFTATGVETCHPLLSCTPILTRTTDGSFPSAHARTPKARPCRSLNAGDRGQASTARLLGLAIAYVATAVTAVTVNTEGQAPICLASGCESAKAPTKITALATAGTGPATRHHCQAANAPPTRSTMPPAVRLSVTWAIPNPPINEAAAIAEPNERMTPNLPSGPRLRTRPRAADPVGRPT